MANLSDICCQGRRADGKRCQSRVAVLFEDGKWLCASHSPSRKVKVLEGSVRARAVRATRERRFTKAPETAAEATELLGHLSLMMLRGRMPHTEGSKIAGVLKTFLDGLQVSAMESEIKRLREELGTRKRGR